jgi:hypothetical protein
VYHKNRGHITDIEGTYFFLQNIKTDPEVHQAFCSAGIKFPFPHLRWPNPETGHTLSLVAKLAMCTQILPLHNMAALRANNSLASQESPSFIKTEISQFRE